MKKDSALIIFARYPRPGQVKTRLGKDIGMEKAADVYRRLAGRTFDIGDRMAQRGHGVYLYFEPRSNEMEMRSWVNRDFRFLRQEGSDLGERMRRSFETTFNEGASKSVIIGTDIPDLDSAIVKEAFDLLGTHEVVIGPSNDGGYYLLGMQRPVRDLFSGIAWSTGSVFPETVARLRDLGVRWQRLKTLSDIDTSEDYDRLLGKGPHGESAEVDSGE